MLFVFTIHARIQFSKTALDYATEEDKQDVVFLIEVRLSASSYCICITTTAVNVTIVCESVIYYRQYFLPRPVVCGRERPDPKVTVTELCKLQFSHRPSERSPRDFRATSLYGCSSCSGAWEIT